MQIRVENARDFSNQRESYRERAALSLVDPKENGPHKYRINNGCRSFLHEDDRRKFQAHADLLF